MKLIKNSSASQNKWVIILTFVCNLDWAHLINKVENVLQGKRVQRGKLVFYLRVIAAF